MFDNLVIAAGKAFGSGAHPSTNLCLQTIHGIALSGMTVASVLDVGCGSGILSIAVAKAFPPSRIIASDVDSECPFFVQHNMQLNHIPSHQITVIEADGVQHSTIQTYAPYDLILCNISASAIIPLIKSMDSMLSIDGILVVSGIQQSQQHLMLDAMNAANYHPVGTLSQDGWCAIMARHTNR